MPALMRNIFARYSIILIFFLRLWAANVLCLLQGKEILLVRLYL